MAASSSVRAAKGLVGVAVSGHGASSASYADRLALPSGLALSSLAGLSLSTPDRFNRDRFVLSAGHGCMLQYALLHLAGYDSVKVRPLIFSEV
ncbi:hypothetical protein B296_00020098 [Ensete ventricosum]|uniref:Transketolase N-terminal domain-containing protein n=1 Tax=Ensete ventricosum TaxID=4639 RepID=A0A427A953_ENSVE|nr:hypothetical protein B296_00020098 [Ensete ventricosum]